MPAAARNGGVTRASDTEPLKNKSPINVLLTSPYRSNRRFTQIDIILCELSIDHDPKLRYLDAAQKYNTDGRVKHYLLLHSSDVVQGSFSSLGDM